MTAEQMKAAGMSDAQIAAVLGTQTKNNAIALKDVSKSGLQWNYGDLADGKPKKITGVTVGSTKKGSKCFEVGIEGRTEPIRMMPITAINSGLAEVIGDEVILNAEELVANKTESGVELSKVS